MSFVDKVNPGQKLTASAMAENAKRELVSKIYNFSDKPRRAEISGNLTCLVCNKSSATLSGAVGINSGSIDNECLYVERYDKSKHKMFGVLPESLPSGRYGVVILSGCAKVSLTGASGDYAEPASNGSFARSDTGNMIIASDNDGNAIIALMPGRTHEYTGNFAVTLGNDGKLHVSGGWINRNGQLYGLLSKESVINPATGYVCVHSRPIDKYGNWSEPECKIMDAPDQCSYPVAQVTVIGSRNSPKVTIRQYPVTVATLLYSKLCNMAEL